jgi:gamma-glutamyltranspeptidase/glutathione hydrolase
LAFALFIGIVASAASQDAVRGKAGMVASRSPIASHVGAKILEQGGNAIDAAVAVGFTLAVTYPSAGNLGGGGFMVIRLADGTVLANDHRERAPTTAYRDMYLDDDGNVIEGLSMHSHMAVGVPGTVAGLLSVHGRFGKLRLANVIDPAIELARNGFPLPYDLASQFQDRLQQFNAYPASREVFTNADGERYEQGDVFVQQDLADTLERIKAEGRDGFYKSKTADLFVAEMKRGGGLITHGDLAGYESLWREPVHGFYRGYEIVSMPPPSSGGVLLVQILNMLEAYDIAAMGYGSAVVMHHMIEAERRAYADRAQYLGDPDFYPVPIPKLTDKAYAVERFSDFDPKRASESTDIGWGLWPEEGMETTHASIIDADGNAVAYTTTLNLSFGAKMVVAGAGFLLNNEMDDFSIKKNAPNAYGLIGGEANEIAPGKRMLSSMTPTIVLRDGEPILVTGSPGGSTIITTVLQVIVNVLDHGMDLSDAVGKPRFHHQWLPDRILLEKHGFSPDTLARLGLMGHRNLNVMSTGRGIGDANSVMRLHGELRGVSDPRNSGAAAGN